MRRLVMPFAVMPPCTPLLWQARPGKGLPTVKHVSVRICKEFASAQVRKILSGFGNRSRAP